jgi:predicted DNA-binding protein (MmcQ/YjbR family)
LPIKHNYTLLENYHGLGRRANGLWLSPLLLQYDSRMEIDWVRKFCLSLPNVTEQIRWEDDLVFKVGGKMFAVVALEPGPTCMAFKCSPEAFAELIERPGITPSKYLAGAHWVSLENEDALPRDEIRRLMLEAHSLVFAKLPKKVQEKLRGEQRQRTQLRARKRVS